MRRAPIYFVLLVLAGLTLIPFSYMVITSFKDNTGNAAGLFLPRQQEQTLPLKPADIDPATDTITLSGTLYTGDPLVYQSDKGGIGGLARGHTYYAIGADNKNVTLPAGQIKLADSPEHAAAGIAIDLTSSGDDAGQKFINPDHVLWKSFTLGNYKELFHDNLNIKYQIANSFFFASVTSLLATLACAMGGYALAMFHFKGRKILTSIVLAALIIPATMLIAPNYQLIYRMHLLDTLSGLILPAIGPAFLVFLFRQSMISGLPQELLEAGRMDGCGEIRMFFTIALPLIRPMVSASLLITFIASWNNFINPQVILQSPQNFTLSVAVAQLQDAYSIKYGTLMAGTAISVLPVMVLFFLLQKEFIAGLTAGAVKG